MADIAVGGNRSTLTTIAGDWNTAANSLDSQRRPNGGEGKTKRGSYTGNGTGAATTFTVTHNAGFTPTRATKLVPRNAASAIGAWASNFTATTFVINTATAIASGTGNVQYDWTVAK